MTNLAALKKWRMSKLLPPKLAIVMILIHSIGFSQQGKELLIEANDTHNVNLFFPDVITKFILGSPNFKFSFEPNTQIGSIQSKKGKDSNLTVITNDGRIYSFLLHYKDNITNFNIFVDQANSIGSMKPVSGTTATSPPPPTQKSPDQTQQIPEEKNTKPTPVVASSQPEKTPVSTPTPTPVPPATTPTIAEKNDTSSTTTTTEPSTYADTTTEESTDDVDPEDMFLPPPSDDGGVAAEQDDLYFKDREEYYRIFCENNFMQPSYIKRTFTTSKNVILRLNNILGDRNELYFILQIENGSKSTYETDFLNFFTQKKSPKDQVLMEPVYKYNLQEKIEPQGINEVVYVFKRFKINPKEKVVIVLDEKEGRRTLVLSIFDKQINTIKI